MKKLIIIILVLGIVILAVILVLKRRPITRVMPVVMPKSSITPFIKPTVVIPTGQKLKISGVEINNIYLSPVKVNQEKDVLVSENKDYHIVYLALFKKFLITIYNPDFEKTRTFAEKDFLDKLGISETEACKLTVEINTIQSVNKELAGKIFPLSFCPPN